MNTDEREIISLYRQLLQAWNDRDAGAMAELFTEDGESIGFDGSSSVGRQDIFAHLQPIFEHHPTAPYVSKIRSVRVHDGRVAILRSIAGMIPPGQSDLNPNVNTHHTIVAIKKEGVWRIELYQNTPAQFHGRPELVDEMTNELREAWHQEQERETP
ncbi:hypothetical protein J31TS4_03800 [Paenibacillus sp. J31TS4]|uniref:SgcJ/EcaC family oxidoreductase n=1 Tax=Paenibacillus sp. J31TS4 TaxID=2807195 RepID=UPI001B2A4D09|nr:SgcJ/EcaC family oxidoreductase [Paenibacillus sp. J31TS4]GIP37100.1 hypothetical protein J31TS4_03800 [Paenibacillus sp. J31TS4]